MSGGCGDGDADGSCSSDNTYQSCRTWLTIKAFRPDCRDINVVAKSTFGTDRNKVSQYALKIQNRSIPCLRDPFVVSNQVTGVSVNVREDRFRVRVHECVYKGTIFSWIKGNHDADFALAYCQRIHERLKTDAELRAIVFGSFGSMFS